MSSEPRVLRIEFATAEAFRSEYVSNISNGGIFIATRSAIEVRDLVRVEITLGFCQEHLSFEGEVVHRVPEELAETGATPGVAVQFNVPASEIRTQLEPFAGRIEETDERVTESGRRRAPRSTARVPARVSVGRGKKIKTRTRNVSTTGALLSVDDAAVPVGKRVKVALQHPTTGESMEVEGRVVRQMESEAGRVAALGVQFQPPEAREEEVRRFVGDLKASEHSRRLGGINGAVSEIGIENLLQMFGSCAQQGTLTVSNGPEEGFILFEGGLLRLARVGRTTGRQALARMLSWREGRFEFQARLDETEFPDPPLPLEGAILEAVRLLDEQGRDPAAESAGDVEIDIEAALDQVRIGADTHDEDDDDVEEEEDDEFGDMGEVLFDPAEEEDPAPECESDAAPDRADESNPEESSLGDEEIESLLDDDVLGADLLADEPLVSESLTDVPELIAPGATLSVETARLRESRHDLGKTEEAVLDLAQVGMNVAKILDVIPEPEGEVMAVLRSLVERGLVVLDD